MNLYKHGPYTVCAESPRDALDVLAVFEGYDTVDAYIEDYVGDGEPVAIAPEAPFSVSFEYPTDVPTWCWSLQNGLEPPEDRLSPKFPARLWAENEPRGIVSSTGW